MKYLLQVYLPRAWWSQLVPAARGAFVEACRAHTAALAARGYLLAAQFGDDDATTLVTQQAGAIAVRDGPLPATQAYLIEHYYIEARDLNHAIAVAAHMPQAQGGVIEVVPLAEVR